MNTEIPRTRETNLTDDELILFDAMFDCSVRYGLLRPNNFLEAMNFGYTHSLSEEQLWECILHLSERGLIFIKQVKVSPEVRAIIGEEEGGHLYISMTAAGGRLWARERCPNWHLFCSYSEHYRDEAMKREFMGMFPSAVLQMVARSIEEENLSDSQLESLRFWRLKRDHLPDCYPWNDCESAVCASIQTNESYSDQFRWELDIWSEVCLVEVIKPYTIERLRRWGQP